MKRLVCALTALALLAARCCMAEEQEIVLANSGDRWTAQLFAMDTFMQATIHAPALQSAEVAGIMQNVLRLESLFSTTDPDSEISAINASGGEGVAVSPDTLAVLQTALAVSGETGGAFDITAYPLVRAWGFTQTEYRVPGAAEIAALLERVDYGRVVLSDGTASVPAEMEIDLGGIAKGYTGDVLTSALREKGVESALLSLGGNIAVIGRKPDGSPWKIGIRDPLNASETIGYVQVEDANVITSGGYERCFADDAGHIWWHIIDPETGYPAENGLISATVIGRNGAQCDALSTALFVMGADAAAAYLRSQAEVDAVLIREDGSLLVTDGLEGQLVLAGAYQNRQIEWIRR